MKPKLFQFILSLSLVFWATGTSAAESQNYSITTDALNSGGTRNLSANYSNEGSFENFAGISSAADLSAKHGFIPQLYNIDRLLISASSTNMNEGTVQQISALAVLDDDTFLTFPNGGISWSILDGPIISIDRLGLAHFGNVYTNTPATIKGAYLARNSTLNMMVLNTGNDDYGPYAHDSIDDLWQIQYFGTNNPSGVAEADADGTGQNNLFKYFADLNPTNHTSVFTLKIDPVVGQPDRKLLTFGPRSTNRVYVVECQNSLLPGTFSDLTSTITSDFGGQRTVLDTNAVSPDRFYRIKISLP